MLFIFAILLPTHASTLSLDLIHLSLCKGLIASVQVQPCILHCSSLLTSPLALQLATDRTTSAMGWSEPRLTEVGHFKVK